MSKSSSDSSQVLETVEIGDLSAEWEEVYKDQKGKMMRRRFRVEMKRKRFRLRTKVVVAGLLLGVALWLRPDLAGIVVKEVSHTFRGP